MDTITHKDISDRIDRLEEHNISTHRQLFDKVSSMQVSNNKWIFWFGGAIVSVLVAIVSSNMSTHRQILNVLGDHEGRLRVREQIRVPPPEVILDIKNIKEDARNRERQLDEHVKNGEHL